MKQFSTSATSTDYLASGFHSVGDNVFSAGNGIHIIVPQISGVRNTFDALVVNLENRANAHESHSSSSGVGMSTNLAESAGLMASMNLGASGSRNTYLNEAYIRGAVDFTRAEVTNQGCCVMDITNAGASYRYVPMEEVHESSSFAIGLSGLDLSSPDAFAYSLGRGLASTAASAGVGMLASEAGLGGFVSSLAASLAGAYVNSEVMPQMHDAEHRPTGLGSTGTVEMEHDSRGFRSTQIDFDRTEFNHVIDQVKAKVFDEALDKGLSTQEAVQIAKDSETALQKASITVETTETSLQDIDEHTKADVQEKIIEVLDDAPVAVKCQAQRENLNVLSSSVRNAAQQKIQVLNQQIAAIEAQKTAMSEKIQQTPGVKETVTTVFDSMLDGLKSARDYCTYVVHNPLEAIEYAYNFTTTLGGMVVDKTTDMAKFVWNHPSEALDLTTAKFSAMYNSAKDDIFGTSLDAAEYIPFGIGSLVEGSRDVHGIWFAKDRDLRSVTDKWRNYGLIGAICGKGSKKVAKELVEVVGKNLKRLGRTGKQARLREIMHDDKQSSVVRGWLTQRKNASQRLNLPPGYELAHRRGFEASKGYGYEFSDPQLIELHRQQHIHDQMGRLNKDRGKK